MSDIRIDTSNLTYTQFFIPELGADFIEGANTPTISLEPGLYGFQQQTSLGANFRFEVTPDGFVNYDIANDGFLSGRGTTTLILRGFTITLDARSLSHDLLPTIVGALVLPRDSTHELTLVPAAGYTFRPTPGFFADFQFALDVDGQIVVEPRYSGFTAVNGRTLTISGYQITIDGRLLSHDLGLFLLGNRDREILPRDSTHELTLIPAAGYILQPTPGFFADFQFALDVDGQIVVEPRYGGFTTVNGRTLTISGYQITIDGGLLSHDLGLFLLGNEDILSRDSTHELTLIPAGGYTFRLTPGVFADFQFALDVDGQIVVNPQDEDLAGVSARTLTIQSDAMPRRFCGTPDPGGGGIRIAAYGSPGGRWSRGNLTYSVNLMGYIDLSLLPQNLNLGLLPQNAVNGVIAAAFQQWMAIVPFFNFNFLPGGGNADIRIQFGGANLDDRLGKVGGVAGTGGYPGSPNQGNLFFDSSEAWTQAFLLSIALHEIGHVLGLAHSTSRSSLMYPYATSLIIDTETIRAIRALYGWQPQISLNDRGSIESPSLAVSETLSLFGESNKQLYMAWRGIDNDDAIYWSSLDGDIWSPQKPIPGFGSLHGPTLTTGFSRTRPDGVPVSGLFMAWDGVPGDDAIYFAQNLEPAFSDWMNQQRIDGVGTSDRPGLALFNARMHMAWKGIPGDNSIYWSSFDGNNWSPQVQIRGRGTSHGPALAVLGNKLYMFWKGIEDDSNVYYAWIDDQPGTIWQAQRVVAYTDARTEGNVEINIGTSSRPVAAVRGNTIVLAWKGIPGDSGLYFASLENNEWSGQINVAGVGSSMGPGLATLNGRLYMAWKGIPGDNGLYFSWLG